MMLFVSTPLDTQPVHFWQSCIFYRIFCINHRPTLDLCIDIYPPTEQPLRSNHQLSGWTAWCQDLPESLCLLDPSGFLIEYISTSHLEGSFTPPTLPQPRAYSLMDPAWLKPQFELVFKTRWYLQLSNKTPARGFKYMLNIKFSALHTIQNLDSKLIF